MKVAICTPHHADVKAHYAYSLAHLIEHVVRSKPGIELKLIMRSSSLLPKVRAELVEQALRWEADWILWADSDHLFPPDTLLRLLAHDVDVVGCNYPRREPPFGPTASKFCSDGTPVSVDTTPEKVALAALEEVDFLGLGLCLVRARPLAAMELPLFNIGYSASTGGYSSEDSFFFARLRKEGLKIYLDHVLSWEVGHVAQRVLTSQDPQDRNC